MRHALALSALMLGALSSVAGPLSPAITNSVPYQRALWMHQQRAYPLEDIPAGARERALSQIQAFTEGARSSDPSKPPSKDPPPPPTMWIPIGPAPINGGQVSPPQNVTGRLTAIAVDPSNTNHWLVGGANGGVWGTFDSGLTWTPLTDNQASLAMGDIAFAPSTPSVVYAGTGEAHFSGDSYAGGGLLKSTDGGVTWQMLATNTFARTAFAHIKVDPTSASNLVASTAWGLAGRSGDFPPNAPATGIFTSTDGGVTWTVRLKGVGTGLDIDPANFANQYGSLGVFFGDPANGVYRSTNSGVNWDLITGPWAQAQVGRIEIAVSPSVPDTLYVSIQDAFSGSSLGVWRTDNAWAVPPTWTALPAIPNPGFQFWYDHVLTVDPTNNNVIFLGETPLWKYDGTSWTAIGGDYDNQTRGRKIHPDQHSLAWVGGTLIVGNDGGLWSSPDRGSSFVSRNGNLALTQFYDGSIHPSNPNFALGGAQDNGSEIWTGGTAWQWILFGDGCDNAISYSRPDTDWALSSQGLSMFRTTDGGTTFTFAAGGIGGFPLFAAPFEESPNNSDIFLAGTDSLWKSTNFFSGSSPAWTQNAPGAGFDQISAIAFAPSDISSRTYAYGNVSGALHMTSDGGVSWRDIDPANGVPGRYVTGVAFHPLNPNILYVSLSGFDEGTPGRPGHLFVTTNALAGSPTWLNISPPVNIPFNRVLVDPAVPSTVYVATDIAVWKTIDAGSSWNFLGPATGFPNVPAYDLKISRVTNRLIAFTHGRSAFMLNLAAGTGNTADVFASLRANPNPLILGGNLTYTLTVGNSGLQTATNSIATQILPNNVAFISATTTKGSVSQAGGVVTANLGNLGPSTIATVTIVVVPAVPGTYVSTASANSSTSDADTSNNSATVSSIVLPKSSDLAVGLLAAPNPALVGQTLTYSVAVSNFGPSTATGVIVTNSLPPSVGILSVSASQGSSSVSGNNVICFFNTVSNGSVATATIRVVPTLDGTISATATAVGNEVDPVPGNNSASATTIVGPAADLALGLTANPLSVVRGSNIVYTISVTNRGPSAASGGIVNDSLPAGVTVISTNSTKGTLDVSGSAVTATLGPLTNGETARITIGVTTTNVATNVFTLLDSATVNAAEADPGPSGNSNAVSVVIAPPFVSFAIDRAQLTSESIAPPNGAVDAGETVGVRFFVQNIGNVPNTGGGLLVTLLATNGVTSPSGPQNYGNIAPNAVQNRTFSFTASGTNGGSVTANLLLQDASTNQILTYTFQLPSIQIFANTNRIDIPTTEQDQLQPGPASPYPSAISVSGVTGLLSKVTVTLSNLNHTFPHDINLLLVGPTGIKTLLLSDAADQSSVAGADVTFDDSAPAPIPTSGQIVSAAYQVSAYNPSAFLTNPAPEGPYGSSLSAYVNADPNGSWSLYAYDHSQGDFGYVGGGWALAFTTVSPVNQVADLAVSALSTPASVLVGDAVTNTFTINNLGPANISVLWVTNTLSPSVTLLSATNSAGVPFTLNGSILSANLAALANSGSRTVTLVVAANTPGSITNSSLAVSSSGEVDLNPANNSASAIFNAVLPSADLSVSNYASPNPVTVGSNLLVTVLVTNNGPNNALNVVVSNALPAGASLISSNASQGSISTQGSSLVAALGTIAPAGSASVTFTLVSGSQGQLTNTARVSTSSIDGVAGNNSATTITTVLKPLPLVQAAAASLLAENFSPPNASLDPGETVTLSLSLTNSGSAGATNLSATLLAINGVNSPSGPQNYGTILPGASAARSFTFTAGSTSPVVATLQLADSGGYSNQVSFVFILTASSSFTNTAAISIPDHGPATPYPSTISVSGLTGVVDKVTVSIKGLTHTFPHDLDLMLVSPSGQQIMLMSDCGGGHSVSGVDLTFDDAAASNLSESAQIVAGTYKPTDFDPAASLPPPAPNGSVSTSFATLCGINPNGNWSLYVFDDSVGDLGSISGGWSLAITAISPINATVNLILTQSATPSSLLAGGTLAYTFTLTNRGPNTASNVVITDPLPSGVSVISSNTTLGSIMSVGGTIVVTNITLPASAGLSATVRVIPSLAGSLVNVATASSAQTDLDLPSNTAQTTVTVLVPVRATLDIAPATNKQFQITLTGDGGQAYALQGSSNLVNWVPVFTGTTAPNGTYKYTTTNAASFNYRFFRSVRLP